MSLKYAAEKVGPSHYVLPKLSGMKVEAHAYLSDDFYAATDEGLWSQIKNGASYEGVIGAYLMPDTHLGYGVPVGSVIVTEDTVIQAGSGYDISCGVFCMKVPGLTAKKVSSWERRDRWVREVEKRVATGVGSERPRLMPRFSSRTGDDILRFGAKALGVRADVCERQYIDVPESADLKKIERAYSKGAAELALLDNGRVDADPDLEEHVEQREFLRKQVGLVGLAFGVVRAEEHAHTSVLEAHGGGVDASVERADPGCWRNGDELPLEVVDLAVARFENAGEVLEEIEAPDSHYREPVSERYCPVVPELAPVPPSAPFPPAAPPPAEPEAAPPLLLSFDVSDVAQPVDSESQRTNAAAHQRSVLRTISAETVSRRQRLPCYGDRSSPDSEWAARAYAESRRSAFKA